MIDYVTTVPYIFALVFLLSSLHSESVFVTLECYVRELSLAHEANPSVCTLVEWVSRMLRTNFKSALSSPSQYTVVTQCMIMT